MNNVKITVKIDIEPFVIEVGSNNTKDKIRRWLREAFASGKSSMDIDVL